MAMIEVEGEQCAVVESLGYQHSAGVWAKEVRRPNGERRVAVKRYRGAPWAWWTSLDRTAAMVEAMARKADGGRDE